MPWFPLRGDARTTDRCASENCAGQPSWRLEVGGVGSVYCSGCMEKIESTLQSESRSVDDKMITETITFKFKTVAQQIAFRERLNGAYMAAGGEHTKALELANKLLDSPWCDPDDDTRLLCRQLIRSSERAGSAKVVLANLLDALWDSGATFADDSEVGLVAGKAWTFLGEKPMRPRPDSPASASAETNASPEHGALKEGTPSAGSLKCRDPVCSIKGDHYLTDACDQMKDDHGAL